MRTLQRSLVAAGVLSVAVVVAFTAPPSAPTAAPAPSGPVPVAAAVQAPVVPDTGGHRVDDHDHGDGEFSTYGTKWNRTALTYGFVNHTGDVGVLAQETAIANALATWSSVSPLTFTRVPDCGAPFDAPSCTTPDIRIAFGTGSHGGGGHDPDFDGRGGTVAHAFYPPPNGASAAGDLHFDDAERWTTNGNGVDLQSIALHELGHALGLGHAAPAQCPLSTSPSRPIMCATIVGVDRTVAPDDINGIQALYGLPADACGGRAVTVDLAEGERPTNGPDVIRGTAGPDKVYAGGGADIVCGLGGNDTVDLGPGNDRAIGGAGHDILRGGSGNDRLYGGGGNDRLAGGDHHDQMFGSVGADVLDGGRGADKLYAGPQRDSCHGRAGRDAHSGCERRAAIELRLR